MLKSMRRISSNSVSIVLSLAIALSPVSGALAQAGDTEAPVLIHRQIDAGVAGELQTFLARVSDDFGIEGVTLHYRQGDVGEFNELAMRPLIDSIGEYMIAIETSVSEYPGLQYYIEAVDSSGNKTNRGYAYAPIVLPLAAPATTTPTTTPGPIVDTQRAPETVATKPAFELNTTAVLIGVGALLALGALASGGSGGESEPTNPTGPPTTGNPDTVTLTIISDVPVVN